MYLFTYLYDYIFTELMKNGSLLEYLSGKGRGLKVLKVLLSRIIQIK